jgi:hypothetical protein
MLESRPSSYQQPEPGLPGKTGAQQTRGPGVAGPAALGMARGSPHFPEPWPPGRGHQGHWRGWKQSPSGLPALGTKQTSASGVGEAAKDVCPGGGTGRPPGLSCAPRAAELAAGRAGAEKPTHSGGDENSLAVPPSHG